MLASWSGWVYYGRRSVCKNGEVVTELGTKIKRWRWGEVSRPDGASNVRYMSRWTSRKIRWQLPMTHWARRTVMDGERCLWRTYLSGRSSKDKYYGGIVADERWRPGFADSSKYLKRKYIMCIWIKIWLKPIWSGVAGIYFGRWWNPGRCYQLFGWFQKMKWA